MFVTKVKHPAGDIAQLLLLNGLARCADWMSPLLGGEGMQKLRDAERYTISQTEVNDRQAKARKLNLWRGHTAKAAQTTASFDAVVLKIVNGDTIEVGPKQGVGRRTIQFSSIRQPKSPPPRPHNVADCRTNDPKQAAWQLEVKEYLRKRLVGKTVLPEMSYF